jgi:hypothetical protein
MAQLCCVQWCFPLNAWIIQALVNYCGALTDETEWSLEKFMYELLVLDRVILKMIC